jgi:hypothetical protein
MTYQQPTSEEITLASQDSSSYLTTLGARFRPDFVYSEPYAYGMIRIDNQNDFNLALKLDPSKLYAAQPNNLYISQLQIYKNPNLNNPRSLTCGVMPMTWGLSFICR